MFYAFNAIMENEKTVLVTGGAGYLGSILVPLLCREGYRVRVFDKGYFGFTSLDAVKNRIDLVIGDVRSFDDRLAENVDTIIHLAGFSNDPTANYNPAANESINVEGTKNVIRAAIKYGVPRFLFASSCSVYHSENPEEDIKTEETIINPTTFYARSKFLAEQALQEAASASFVPIILRMGTLYGASPRMRYDLAVNTFTKDAFKKNALTIHLRGKTWRPFLHLQNAAHAYMHFIQNPHLIKKPEIINLLEDNILINVLAYRIQKTLKDIFNTSPAIELQDVVGAPRRSYQVANAKMNQFNLSFPLEIEKGVKEIWEHLQENPDIESPIFYNIRWLETLSDMEQRFTYLKNIF